MIAITKAEKERINEWFPDVGIVRTMRQKSKRHHYYVEESPRVLKLLEAMRMENATCIGGAEQIGLKTTEG